jgi:hypothetical protein
VRGDVHHTALLQKRVLGEHAVHAAAVLGEELGSEPPVQPADEVSAGDTIAHGSAADAHSDGRRDLTRAIADRDDAWLRWEWVRPGEDHEITTIQRGCPHSHQHVVRAGRRPITFAENETVHVAELLDPVGFHPFPFQRVDRDGSAEHGSVSKALGWLSITWK